MSFSAMPDNRPINYGSAFNTYYTYSFINNAQFYPLVPSPYIDFYQRFIRQWFYWYDGYVPYFHIQDNGMMSTRLATTLVKKVASQINGGRLLLETNGDEAGKDDLDFAEKWVEEDDFSTKVDSAVEFAGAGGTSLIKLNSDGKKLWTQPMRLDNFFVDTDFAGNVVDFTGFIQSFTKTIRENEQNYLFYLLERRYYGADGKPKVKYIVKRSKQNITTARDYNISEIQDIDWESIPKKVKEAFKKQFGGLTIGVESTLPFDDLGCYLIKFTPHISNLPQLPFGESLFATIIAHLMSYDYYFSAINTNMYLGRSRVLLPKHMQNPNNRKETNYNDGLDSFAYTRIPYSSPDKESPIPLQFDLRANDWNTIRNHLLEAIATHTGLNASTLAGYLGDNTARTAREISSEEGATALFVENKRELIKTPLNALLNTVLKYYKKKQGVIFKFSKSGTTNFRNLVEIGQILKNMGLDDRTLVEMMFNDKSQVQIDSIIKRMEERKQEEREFEMEQKEVQEPELPLDNGNIKGTDSVTSSVPKKEKE